MKKYIITIVSLFTFFLYLSCNTIRLQPKQIIDIAFNSRIEFPLKDSVIFSFADTCHLFFYKKLVMVEKFIRTSSDTINFSNYGKEYYYVFIDKEKNLAYKSIGITPHTFIKCNYDSVLKNDFFDGFKFIKKDSGLYKLVNYSNKSSEEITETYRLEKKMDYTYPDTQIYIYNKKFPPINFTFNALMEEKQKAKLCKVVYLYNHFLDSNSIRVPKRHWEFQINENVLTNDKINTLKNSFVDFENFIKLH